MLHAPVLLPTAKLDISLLLKSSPSPPPPDTHPPLSRSASGPASSSHLPTVSSPTTSSTSQLSTSTAPLHTYNAPPQQQQQLQQQQQQQQVHQQQIYSQRRAGPTYSGTALASAAAISKRPPPASTHPSASPAKKHNSKWGPEEDALIIQLRGQGMKWEDISKRLPGRSVIACRLHYQNYLERRTPWDEEKKDKLARLYDRMKPEMWAKVAEDLQVPWRAAESMHWVIGQEEMGRRAGVVPFSMAPAGYGASTSTAGASSSSSVSGMDSSGYLEPPGQDTVGRMPSGLREIGVFGEESEGYGEYEGGLGTEEHIERRVGGRRRRPMSGSGGQAAMLPSLAEFEGGVPAYAGFVGETPRRERVELRGEGLRARRGEKSVSPEEEPEGDQGKGS